MKITKSKLQSIIKEEVEAILQEIDLNKKMKASDARHAARMSVRDVARGGIKDQERYMVTSMARKLNVAAQKGNIQSARILRLYKLLDAELDKQIGKWDLSKRQKGQLEPLGLGGEPGDKKGASPSPEDAGTIPLDDL
tara:strand:- start:342 stop:755 length:414 start_codon:yes stop_codon:yes gene_type:complete